MTGRILPLKIGGEAIGEVTVLEGWDKWKHLRPCPKCGANDITVTECDDELADCERITTYDASCKECGWDLDDYPYYSAWIMWNIHGESSYKDNRPYEEDDVYIYHSSSTTKTAEDEK